MHNRNIVVRTESLSAGFGDHLLFQDLDLTVREGDFSLIRGENGSGKTTLVKIILGFLPPRSGRVYVMGHRVGTREWAARRSQVAYMTQHAVASDFPISALEVVLIGTASLTAGHHQKIALARQAMEATSCRHLEHAPYAVLSGGEKQRVSLARCLAQRARILILDEPTSHLDRQSKTELADILVRLNRDQCITILLVSHEHHDDLPVSRTARQILFADGRVTAEGHAGHSHTHTGEPQ